MSRKISSDFQWLFHLALLRRVIRDHPDTYKDHLHSIAEDIGTRLVNDFCARFQLYKKIKDEDIKKYLKIFLSFYFENSFVVEANEIKCSDDVLSNQRSPGIFLFREILQIVFDTLNGNTIFTAKDCSIVFSRSQ